MEPSLAQLHLPTLKPDGAERQAMGIDASVNQLDPSDRAFHDWYRFVLSFPPHLVRAYLQDFKLGGHHTVLDPFCGTGTTLVESRLNGLPAVGLEGTPIAHLASSVKVDWSIDPDLLAARAREIADQALATLQSQGINDHVPFRGTVEELSLQRLPLKSSRLLIKDSISPLPLHKTLVLLDCLKAHHNEPYYRHELLALGKALVSSIGNLRFGPYEPQLRPAKSGSSALPVGHVTDSRS